MSYRGEPGQIVILLLRTTGHVDWLIVVVDVHRGLTSTFSLPLPPPELRELEKLGAMTSETLSLLVALALRDCKKNLRILKARPSMRTSSGSLPTAASCPTSDL